MGKISGFLVTMMMMAGRDGLCAGKSAGLISCCRFGEIVRVRDPVFVCVCVCVGGWVGEGRVRLLLHGTGMLVGYYSHIARRAALIVVTTTYLG